MTLTNHIDNTSHATVPPSPVPSLNQLYRWITAAGLTVLTPQLVQALRWAAEWGWSEGFRQGITALAHELPSDRSRPPMTNEERITLSETLRDASTVLRQYSCELESDRRISAGSVSEHADRLMLWAKHLGCNSND